MPLATLPDAQLAAPIVPLAPRVEAVVEPAAVTNMLNAFGAGQAVVQRAAQESLSESQALNQIELSNRALSMQEAQAAQSMALNQAQMDEFLSPEQKQARRSRAIVEAIQAKELEESAPERQLLDHYTRRAAISAAIAAPGNYDKKIQAILLHGGDTSGYDPESLLPIDPQVKRKIDQQFAEVMEYDQWQARMDALKKESKLKTRTFVDNATGRSSALDYYETPEGVMSAEQYNSNMRGYGMPFRQWLATPDMTEKVFGSVDELAKTKGLVPSGKAQKETVNLGDTDPVTGGVVTESGRKPEEPTADMLIKLDAAVSSSGDLIRIANAADVQQQKRWLSDNWAPLIPKFVMSANPYDVSSAELLARINGILPQAARGIFGEVGVLTNADMDRYRALLPEVNSPEQRTKALLKVFSEKVGDKLQMYSTMYPESSTVQNLLQSEGFTPEYFQDRRQRRVAQQGVPDTATALRKLELGAAGAAASVTAPVAKTVTGEAAYRDPVSGVYYKFPSGPQVQLR